MGKKMKRIILVIISFVLSISTSLGLVGCKKNSEDIVFNKENQLSDSFFGTGVEFDAYENPLAITTEAKKLIYERMDKLNPSMIRCMIDYRWFTDNLSADGSTWDYYWTGEPILNMFEILDYCEEKGIDVAIGPWRARDGWMDAQLTSDPRWADMTLELFKQFEKRNYTCVKWFVPTNEPNYIAGNNQAIWEQGVKNVYAKFEENGLNGKYQILGTDVSSYSAAIDWGNGLSDDTVSKLGTYSVHMYVTNRAIDTARYQSQIEEIVSTLRKRDSNFDEKDLVIWESGLLDGTTEDMYEHELIDTYDYGLRVTDLALQSLLGGANGISFWELDDAAHFTPMGTNTVWGMFSSLGNSYKRELRPWYHSSMLTLNILRKGNKTYGYGEENFRAVSSVSQDGQQAGIVCVNRNKTDIIKKMKIEGMGKGEKLYFYFFNEDNAMLNEQGYIVPNAVVDGNFEKGVNVTIPANCVLFVTNTQL